MVNITVLLITINSMVNTTILFTSIVNITVLFTTINSTNTKLIIYKMYLSKIEAHLYRM